MCLCVCGQSSDETDISRLYSRLNAFWGRGGVQIDVAMDQCHHFSAEWERLQQSFGHRADRADISVCELSGHDAFRCERQTKTKDKGPLWKTILHKETPLKTKCTFLCWFIWIDACHVYIFISASLCFVGWTSHTCSNASTVEWIRFPFI